jgi:hypothetical protein
MKLASVLYKVYTVNPIKTSQTMEALSELKRIATTNGNQTPPPRAAPRRERRRREREQLRQMKRAADGSNINVSKRGKIS